MIRERLRKLRENMKAAGIDCYLIPTSDYHDSEYVSGFFMVRQYFGGFTGSAGTLVVGREDAALFTDGRYFIQAAGELEGSGIRLMKMGEPGVPTLHHYVEQLLPAGGTLGFDGRVIRADEGRLYEKCVQDKGGKLIWNADPAEGIWEERPPLPCSPVFSLADSYSGESTEKKLARLRQRLLEEKADVHLLTSLDDIAWLLNLRGNDVESCPVFLAYAAVTEEKVLLFARDRKLCAGDRECYDEDAGTEDLACGGKSSGGKEDADKSLLSTFLREKQVELLPYERFYDYAAGLCGVRILLCGGRINYRLLRELPEDAEVIDKPNPTSLMKAVKNRTEMENLRKAHLKDGIAVTEFMYWLKKNVGRLPMNEVSAAEYLEQLRRSREHFLEPSFETICAYKENGAIIHYSAKPGECAEIRPEGLLMVDSGGHYLEGTTDITRTFVLGPVTEEMKKHFTLVLRAMLRLKNTRFLYGCRGINLDIRAREVLWEQGLDYKHGTGHGVGYLLNVHEGPNSFRWKLMPDYQDNAILEEGMVTTDEPGIYIEGSHGIRIENELLCRRGESNEYGQFMYFEDLTCAPIDLEGVEAGLLSKEELAQLNRYHKEVYERLSPYFEGEKLQWLRTATREI